MVLALKRGCSETSKRAGGEEGQSVDAAGGPVPVGRCGPEDSRNRSAGVAKEPIYPKLGLWIGL